MQSDQAHRLEALAHSASLQSAYSSRKPLIRQSTAPPPPYTGPSPNASEEALFPPHLHSRDPTPTPPRLPNDRRLPLLPPDPRTIIPVERTTSRPSSSQSSIQQPSRATSSPYPSLLLPESQVNPSSFLHLPPDVPVKPRSGFNPLSKLSKTFRKATTQSAKQAAGPVSEETMIRIAEENTAGQISSDIDENAVRYTEAQEEARERVRSAIHSLLFRGLTSDEERIAVFSKCARLCKDCGLDFSALLQEPLIEGQIPVYWAILNRPVASPKDEDNSNALIFTLLNASGSLKKTTSDSVRLACMWTSNNALLQHMFWQFPGLSPLSMSDRMLLGPTGGDLVHVEETRDGSGAFVAHVAIRRFRLRMNSSKLIKVEFITFERIWTAKFLVSAESTREGLSENKWLFALELENKSTPAWVDADLLVRGRSHQASTSDSKEPVFTIPIGCIGRALQAGPENAIKVRLDDGPMRHHWINDSLTLLDAEGSLHAELHVKLSQPPVPPVPALSPDNSDVWSQVSSLPATNTTHTSNSSSEVIKVRKGKTKPKVETPDKPVYYSLRKGGRLR